MKIIILAAGQGTRLGDITKDKPKCLAEYNGLPLIDHQLKVMRECNINDIVIVKGYMADTLLRDGVRYVMNNEFYRTNMVHSLFCAEKEMTDDIIVSYGDIVYSPAILNALLNAKGDFAVIVDRLWKELWLQRMENPLQDAETMKINDKGFITELGKKPKSYDEIQGQYIGLFKITKNILKTVIKFYHQMDKSAKYDGRDYDNMFMTSFIQILIDSGFPVSAVPVDGGWVEIDRPSDLKLVPVKNNNK